MPGAIAEDRCDWTQGWTETNSHGRLVEGSSSPGVPEQARAGKGTGLVKYAG